jgi:hypothetical protein
MLGGGFELGTKGFCDLGRSAVMSIALGMGDSCQCCYGGNIVSRDGQIKIEIICDFGWSEILCSAICDGIIAGIAKDDGAFSLTVSRDNDVSATDSSNHSLVAYRKTLFLNHTSNAPCFARSEFFSVFDCDGHFLVLRQFLAKCKFVVRDRVVESHIFCTNHSDDDRRRQACNDRKWADVGAAMKDYTNEKDSQDLDRLTTRCAD